MKHDMCEHCGMKFQPKVFLLEHNRNHVDEGQEKRIEGFWTSSQQEEKHWTTSLRGVLSVLGWEVWKT